MHPGTMLTDAIRQWRTPDAPNAGGPRNRQASIGHGHQVTIAEQAEHWATPNTGDGRRGTNQPDGKRGALLADNVAHLWPTPAERDHRTPNRAESQVRRAEGRELNGQQLPNFVAHLWATPTAMDSEQAGGRGATGITRGPSLDRMSDLWQTPATDSFRSRSGDRKAEQGLDQQARTHWPTPTAEPYGSSQNGINGIGGANERPSANTPSLDRLSRSFLPPRATPTPGEQSSPSDSTSPLRLPPLTQTDSNSSTPPPRLLKAKLNPQFVEWLMGWPIGWTGSGPAATAWCLWRQRMRFALSQLGPG
jgi:hypothetical protein